MISTLADAIDALQVPADGGGLASVLALRDRLEAKIVEAVGALDAAGGWDEADGCPSLGAWLRTRGRMTAGDARRLARTARRLRHLPALRQAWLDGTVSGGHVATVVANLTERTVALLRDQEAVIVPVLAQVEVGVAADAMRSWAAHAREVLDDPGAPRSADAALRLAVGTLLGRHHPRVAPRPGGWTIELHLG